MKVILLSLLLISCIKEPDIKPIILTPSCAQVRSNWLNIEAKCIPNGLDPMNQPKCITSYKFIQAMKQVCK